MRIAVIIATRDRRASLERCLQSIEKQERRPDEVIVAVDGSTDGTLEMLEERYPHVRAVRIAEPAGVGNALHEGSLIATSDVWVNLDDDCELVDTGVLETLERFMGTEASADVVCMKVTAPDGTVRRREIPRRDKRLPARPERIGYFLGGAVAFRASVLRAAGGYPRSIGYGSWENDVAFRLFADGAVTWFLPQAAIVHHAVPSMQNTDLREANYVRNEVLLAARFLPAPWAQVHAALWVSLSLAQAARNNRLRPTIASVREAVRLWSEVRRDGRSRLTPSQARALSALSGRTWY